MSQGNNIKVVARFRPQNSLEIQEGGQPVIDILEDHAVFIKTDENLGPFSFDRAFGMGTSQKELYNYSIKQTLDDVFNGYNGTVFAYGQTGSGKTFTMMGSDIDDENLKGITPRIVEGIFNTILDSPPSVEYIVKVSYIEIYMEKVKDLLNPVNDNLPLHEDKNRGVYVKGLMEIFVSSVEEVYDVMKQGGKSRVIAHTNMNAESSRSHSIFQITVQMKNTNDGKTKVGQLFLVDLAGSEKIGKTGATGQTLEEAKKINKSLSALGNVINSLTDGKSSHIPYRDSKLTRILQESLGGNSRTTLIINCSPSSYNVAETVSTLRFGTRAKNIKNKATVNQALSPEELKAMVKKLNTKIMSFNAYIKSLEGELEVWRSGGSVPSEGRVSFLKSKVGESVKANATSTTPQPGSTLKVQDSAAQKLYNQNKNLGSANDGASPANTEFAYSRSASPSSTARLSTNSPNLSSTELPLSELLLRPMTPYIMGDDEREEFLKRENDLADQLEEKEQTIHTKSDENSQLAKELEILTKELEILRSKSDTLGSELSQSLLDKEKLEYGMREIQISLEGLTDDKKEVEALNGSLKSQLSDLKVEFEKLMNDYELQGVELVDLRSKVLNSKVLIDKVSEASSPANTKQEDASASSLFSGVSMSSDTEIINLNNQIKQLHVSEQTKEELIGKLRAENIDLLRKHTDAEAQYNKLMAEYEEFLEGSIAADEAQSKSESNNLSEVKNKLESQFLSRIDQQSKEINDLQEEKQRRINEINSLNELLSSEKGSKANLEIELLALQADLEKAKLAAQTAQSNAYASLQASAASISRPSSEKRSTSFANNGTASNEAIAVSELQDINQKLLGKLHQAERVRHSLMRDVQNRCEKIIELELSVDELTEKSRVLESKLEKQEQRPKSALLEKNINQLTLLHKEMASNNSELKKQIIIMERKLEARTERITHLEERLEQYNAENEMQKRLIDEMNTQRVIDSSRARTGQTGSFNFAKLPFGRVAKPIRGGGRNGSNSDNVVSIKGLAANQEALESTSAEKEEITHPSPARQKALNQPQSANKNRSSWLPWGGN